MQANDYISGGASHNTAEKRRIQRNAKKRQARRGARLHKGKNKAEFEKNNFNHIRTIWIYTATLKKMHPSTKPLETCTKIRSMKN